MRLPGTATAPNVKKRAHWIKRHAGQVVDEMKLMKVLTIRNVLVGQVVV